MTGVQKFERTQLVAVSKNWYENLMMREFDRKAGERGREQKRHR